MSEEAEGNDAYYRIARNSDKHCKRTSEVTGDQKDYKDFQRIFLVELYDEGKRKERRLAY